MKLFAVEKRYFIESYYREYDLIGIYDTREAAEKQIESELQKFRRQHLSSLIYQEVHQVIYPTHTEIAHVKSTISDLEDTYPVFDKERVKDKEYHKEHTKRKHAVSALIYPLQVRLRDLQDALVKETNAEVEAIMSGIGFVDRYYNGVDLDTYFGKFDKMRVKEIELNKPIPLTQGREYDDED